MLLDKLLRPVQVNDTIAVSEVSMDSNMRCIPHLVFAEVLGVNKIENTLCVSFMAGYVDNCFTNEEFVVIKSDTKNEVSLASDEVVNNFNLTSSSMLEMIVLGVIST
jgi:hypothetical protein